MSLSLDLGGGRMLQISIRTSSRATRVKLVSGIEGVHAVVPSEYDEQYLVRFAQSKRDWLLKTSRYYDRLKERCGGYEQGTVFYAGSKYRCNFVSDRQFSAMLSDSIKVITFHVPDRRRSKKYVQEWYRGQTARIISERLPVIASRLGRKYNRVSVKKLQSRWGSCSKEKNLNFNLLLAAAPPDVVDYVIVHELTHLLVLDHSPKFWELVSQADPDYLAHRKWLSTYSPLIRI